MAISFFMGIPPCVFYRSIKHSSPLTGEIVLLNIQLGAAVGAVPFGGAGEVAFALGADPELPAEHELRAHGHKGHGHKSSVAGFGKHDKTDQRHQSQKKTGQFDVFQLHIIFLLFF